MVYQLLGRRCWYVFPPVLTLFFYLSSMISLVDSPPTVFHVIPYLSVNHPTIAPRNLTLYQ